MGICRCLPVQACPDLGISYRPLPCDFSSRIPIPLHLWVNGLNLKLLIVWFSFKLEIFCFNCFVQLKYSHKQILIYCEYLNRSEKRANGVSLWLINITFVMEILRAIIVSAISPTVQALNHDLVVASPLDVNYFINILLLQIFIYYFFL